MFKYYVMNERFNECKIEPFNIFDNWKLDEAVQREVKKYLRAPSKYKHIKQYANPYLNREEIALYGFDGFCEELRSLIMWAEWGRCEYEILVGSLFTTELCDVVRELHNYDSLDKLKEDLIKENDKNTRFKKIDCYMQCEKNIPMIAREVIWQWKHREKDNEI